MMRVMIGMFFALIVGSLFLFLAHKSDAARAFRMRGFAKAAGHLAAMRCARAERSDSRQQYKQEQHGQDNLAGGASLICSANAREQGKAPLSCKTCLLTARILSHRLIKMQGSFASR